MAAIWPCFPLITSMLYLPTALGIVNMGFNVLGVIMSPLLGYIYDSTDPHDTGIGYTYQFAILIAITLISLIFNILL